MAPGATSIHYAFVENGNRYFINVSSDESARLATLVDTDVLIYLASYLTKQQNHHVELGARPDRRCDGHLLAG